MKPPKDTYIIAAISFHNIVEIIFQILLRRMGGMYVRTASSTCFNIRTIMTAKVKKDEHYSFIRLSRIIGTSWLAPRT